MSKYPCPGVYVEEKSAVRLSITHGETAVPAFVFSKTLDSKDQGYIKLNSWLDADANTSLKSAPKMFNALRIYFENGGGYCYVVEHDKLSTVLDRLDDVTLLVQAGEPTAAALMQTVCEKFRLFGIYDSSDGSKDKPKAITEKDTHAAVYGPALSRGSDTDIPASAAVAGVFCTTDRDRGVWKAPANVAIRGGYAVAPLSDDDAPTLITGINAIRRFNDGPPLVWGARTAAVKDDNWRFVPVRRLFNSVEKDIQKSLKRVVFEPNNAHTWELVRGAIDNYLHQLWVDGALLGETPEDAYSVLVGLGATMTAQDLMDGRMKVKVGLAAARPAEQIILMFSQKMGDA